MSEKSKIIVALTDYKGNFGSKYFSKPYRSGFDRDLLINIFAKYGFDLKFKRFDEFNIMSQSDKSPFYLYTSSEDIGYYYKSYIEDLVFSLECIGCNLIPGYKYLRANNNKVFMEILRNQLPNKGFHTIKSFVFGTREECLSMVENYIFPVVVKTAQGASGSGVFKADNVKELDRIIKKISRTPSEFYNIWDSLRALKHKGYKKESKYRRKFIVQEFIPGLKNDYKVLVYGSKFYILNRGIRAHDFRASGSKTNYKLGEDSNPPNGIFDFALQLKSELNVPNISIDIAFDGSRFHLLEFQCLYFGTYTQLFSECYYERQKDKWIAIYDKLTTEEVYAESIVNFIRAL